MELLKHEVYSQAIENTYTIQHHFEGVLVYKEWIDSKDGKCLDFILRSKDGFEIDDPGKCLDFILRSKDGFEIDDPALVEEVQDFVDTLNN